MDYSQDFSLAVIYMDDIRAHKIALRNAAQEAGRVDNHLRHLDQKRKAAEEALRRSDVLRRSLLYLPSTSSYTPSFEATIEVWTQLFPGNESEGLSCTPDLGMFLTHTFTVNEELLNDTQKSIVEFARTSIPHTYKGRFLTRETFWKSVLTKDGFQGTLPLSMETVYYRLRKFEAYKLEHTHVSETDGSIWLDSTADERQRELLQISALFPKYLEAKLASTYRYAYLDDIVMSSTGRSLEEISLNCSRNKDNYVISPPKVKGKDLIGKDNTLLGTVMQIDNALSPSFVKKFIDAMDKSPYTQDGKYNKHDRGYRFSSIGHGEEDGTLPCWLLFGDDVTSNLLLSQHVNKFEGLLLRIVNYIYHLYSEFVNNRLQRNLGKKAVMKWGLPTNLDGYYDSIMTMVANPVNSTYGMHDDGKPGLCTPNKMADGDDVDYTHPNLYSKFNLVVPTLCIQNHSKKTTQIEFLTRGISLMTQLASLNATL